MRRDLSRVGRHLIILSLCLTSTALADQGARTIARRSFGAGRLRLLVDRDGLGTLRFTSGKGEERAVACDRLVGSWGLWVGDGVGVPRHAAG